MAQVSAVTANSMMEDDPMPEPGTLGVPSVQQQRHYSMPNLDCLQSESIMARFLGLSDDETERLKEPGKM